MLAHLSKYSKSQSGCSWMRPPVSQEYRLDWEIKTEEGREYSRLASMLTFLNKDVAVSPLESSLTQRDFTFLQH